MVFGGDASAIAWHGKYYAAINGIPWVVPLLFLWSAHLIETVGLHPIDPINITS
jgi:hypothetical protein